LPAVALELLGEKALEPAALVTAGLVVDHPARAALVHEAPIDHDAPESPGREPGEGQLARRLTVSGAEEPPSALVGDRASERRQDLPGRIFLLPLGHARALKVPRYRLAGALESLGGGERGGVREAREEGVHDGSHVALGLADPAELARIERGAPERKMRQRGRRRQLGRPPSLPQAPQRPRA